MSLSPDSIQQMITEALVSSRDLRQLPSTFLTDILSGTESSAEAIKLAAEIVYKRFYYSFVVDMHLDSDEEQRGCELQRLLRIDDVRTNELNYEVGLAIYKRSFKDAVSDGELTSDEIEYLKSVAEFFTLRRRDINGAISRQALWFYSFKLSEALQDGILSEDEMADLAVVAKNWGLTSNQLSTISVPEKMEILRTALTTIKANGTIGEEDREYIRSLTQFLNAGELLKPCMMDLDLYATLFAIRQGKLPEIDPGNLILENAEHLHHKVLVIYEYPTSGKTSKQTGTLYVGSVKLRFVGRTKSHEIRYKNILEVAFQQTTTPRLHVTVSSGKGTGTYRLSKKNSPAALLELKEMIGYLIRKARRMIEPRGRASSYIPEHVRSEVYARDLGQCVMCSSREYLEFDHIIPRSKGGASTVNNLQLLCRKCNSEKSDRI